MELCSALNGSLTRQARWRKTTIRLTSLGRWNCVPPWAVPWCGRRAEERMLSDFHSYRATTEKMEMWSALSSSLTRQDGTVFRPEQFLDAARWNCVPPWAGPWRGRRSKERWPFDFHSFRATTGKMKLCSAPSGSLTRQARIRKTIIRFPFLQGDYWEDGTVFCPERFLDAAGALKKNEKNDLNFLGWLLGRWNSVPPWAFLNEAGTLTIWFPFFQGDYWEDGLVFHPERFLDTAGALKKDDHLIPILSGRLLGRWNSVPPWAVPWRGRRVEERRPSDSFLSWEAPVSRRDAG